MSPFHWFLLFAFVGVYGALALGFLGNAVYRLGFRRHRG